MRGRSIGSSLTAAPAGAGAPDDGGSYGCRAGARSSGAGREGGTSGASSSPGSRLGGRGQSAGGRAPAGGPTLHARWTPYAQRLLQEPDAATAGARCCNRLERATSRSSMLQPPGTRDRMVHHAKTLLGLV